MRPGSFFDSVRPRLPPSANRVRRIFGHLLIAGGLLLCWQTAVQTGLIRSLVFSSPLKVFYQLLEILSSSESWYAIGVTLFELTVGVVFGGLTGALLGSLFARMPIVDRMFKPLVLGIYTLPRLALLPLLVIWLGLGPGSKIALAFFHVLVIFMLGAYAAVSGIEQRLVSSCRLFGASRYQVIRLVYLPGSLPYLATSMRQALGLALGSVVLAEMVNSFEGIGFETSLFMSRFEMSGVIAWVMISSCLALMIDYAFVVLQRRTLRWAAIKTST